MREVAMVCASRSKFNVVLGIVARGFCVLTSPR
jgi:hypothetical protein